MITAIYSLMYVHGAELWLLFWFLCALAYWGICPAFRMNRTKRGLKNTLMGFLIAEVIVDLFWALIYYHNAVYINYGIGAVYGILVWIPALLITAAVVTMKNCEKRAA